MDLEIDSYRDDEVKISAELATKAFSEYEPIAPVFTSEFFRYLWTMPGIDRDLLICARSEGKVVGQVFVLPRKARVGKDVLDVGTVAVVGVHPEFKRKGIARALMKKAIAASKERGFSGLTLFTTPPWNAYALYESLGFKTFYSSNLQMKVLDAKVLARAMGAPLMAPFMKLKAGIKQRSLPDGFKIRKYEESDRAGCVAMVNEYSKGFDYSEVVNEDSWAWWQESMSKKLKPISYVMENNGKLVGFISGSISGIRAKSKKGEMVLQLGSVGNFCYKKGYEEQAQGLLTQVLMDMKSSGFAAASNGFSPSVFRPTELMNTIWKKNGFIGNKKFELRFMYLSFDPRFNGLESKRSFFYQPF